MNDEEEAEDCCDGKRKVSVVFSRGLRLKYVTLAGKRVEFCYGERLTNQSESWNNKNPVCGGFSRLFVNISSSWRGVVFASVASAPCTRQ